MAKLNKILKRVMSLTYPFCRHGSEDAEIVEIFRKINNLAHEAEIVLKRKSVNDHKLNNPKD
jgi:hypothetical protein